MIPFSAEAILASSTSKFGIEIPDSPEKLGFAPGLLPAPHLLVEREQERCINRGSDHVRDHHYHIPLSNGDDDQPPQTGKERATVQIA